MTYQKPTATKVNTGAVKWFSKVKGYGFIVPDGYRNLFEDDRVTYDLVDKGKGPQAQNVRLLHAY